MAKRRRPESELDPDRSVRDEFYPGGRKRGVVVRVQVHYARSGKLLRYALALIDMRATADHARILEYDNAHGYHHRHWQGSTESVEIMSYEDTEARFETEVRSWGKNGGRAARDIFQSDASERPSIGSWRAIDSGGHTVF